jgi:hypothetical protein
MCQYQGGMFAHQKMVNWILMSMERPFASCAGGAGRPKKMLKMLRTLQDKFSD